jgi:predicted RNA polymerase sigma factor
VLQVLYLIFNEGYASSSGTEVARTELSAEAIRLCRSLAELLPDDPEVTGLLALMLLTDARRPARTGAAGELVPLAEQDRSLWSADLIAEGVALVTSAMQRGRIGDYQLQAAIAALHDEAPSAAATDWRQIMALYGLLEQMTGNPLVTLNRAIAASMVDGPATGLALLDPLLRGNPRLEAVRGHLLEQAGDRPAAIAAYRSAAARTTSMAERSYLLARAARIAG